MRRVLPVILTVLTLGFTGNALAGQFYGGHGYLHTNAATVLAPGALSLSIYDRVYVGKPDGVDYFVTNATSSLAAAFGFSRHLELGFTQIMYQDLNGTPREDGTIKTLIPGNTYIRFKFAGYPLGNNMFYGGMSALRYRVGLYQNIQFEPYQSGGIEIEIGGVLSYYVKPLYPEEAPSFHLNLGILNHNDASTPFDGSQELNFLVSGFFPRPRFDYGAELYGAFFYKEPLDFILSRENWMYLTPFVRYKLFKGLNFTLGLDLLMMGGDETTIPAYTLPNYPGYRLTGKIQFTPSTAFYSAPTFAKADAPITSSGRARNTYSGSANTGGGASGSPMFNRQELFRWGIEERGGEVQAIDLDLEKLRMERKKAEEELNALKAKLEERKKTEQK